MIHSHGQPGGRSPAEPSPSDVIFERALSSATILNARQRENALKKRLDLTLERTVWESTPFRLILEPNRRCNIACTMCDVKHKKDSDLPQARIEELFEELGPGLFEVQPFGSGEPTLGPIAKIARLARRHNNYLNFITNGILFDAEYYQAIVDVTSRVQFSLHSHVPAVAERIAVGQPFARVVKNLKDAVRIGAEYEAHVMCSAVVMNSNFDALPDYIRFVASLGIRRTGLTRLYPTSDAYAEEGIELFRSAQEIQDKMGEVLDVARQHGVYLETNVDALVHDSRNVPTVASRFDVLIDCAYMVDLYQREACISTAISAFVEYDGTVLPCFQHRIPLGNIFEGSFDDAWNGAVMQAHRASFLDDTMENYCRICRVFFCKHKSGSGGGGQAGKAWLDELGPEERRVVDLVSVAPLVAAEGVE